MNIQKTEFCVNGFLAALALAESKKYPIEKMVTHRLPLAEAERALRMVEGEFEEEGAIKVVLVP